MKKINVLGVAWRKAGRIDCGSYQMMLIAFCWLRWVIAAAGICLSKDFPFTVKTDCAVNSSTNGEFQIIVADK
jgi:hypothetical protein